MREEFSVLVTWGAGDENTYNFLEFHFCKEKNEDKICSTEFIKKYASKTIHSSRARKSLIFKFMSVNFYLHFRKIDDISGILQKNA